MCFFDKQTIISQLAPNQIFSLLKNNEQFTGDIENTKFTVAERAVLSNKVLFPVITGVVTGYDYNTVVDISFELSKRDKIGLGIFLLIIFILSLLLGFISSDVILATILICFGFLLCVIFLIMYVGNCRRAYKKICRLLDSIP